MALRSTARAQLLADRYNREADQISALEDKLHRLEQKHRKTYSAAMAALPDGVQMTQGRHMSVCAGEPDGRPLIDFLTEDGDDAAR